MGSLLALDQVSSRASLGDRSILDSISLAIDPGEFVALLGPSGAGKTSLLKLLNRLSSFSSGAIQFRDRPIEAQSVLELRRQIVLVGQDCRLLGMTVRDALHYPLRLQAMAETQCRDRVLAWMERLHLPKEWLDRTELELSGGQQQQVAIARALVMEPTLLLLDEPTSAQDVGAATRILSTIQAQVRERQLAVIMSNHQLDLAEQFCDRVLYLDQGRLITDQPASKVDWHALRESILAADAREQEEWGE
ncbi:MAG: ATP-binding cassette domain-containing protein [Leptolyngbyaceae cyanobacterium]